jgi:hypothetical protein
MDAPRNVDGKQPRYATLTSNFLEVLLDKLGWTTRLKSRYRQTHQYQIYLTAPIFT